MLAGLENMNIYHVNEIAIPSFREDLTLVLVSMGEVNGTNFSVANLHGPTENIWEARLLEIKMLLLQWRKHLRHSNKQHVFLRCCINWLICGSNQTVPKAKNEDGELGAFGSKCIPFVLNPRKQLCFLMWVVFSTLFCGSYLCPKYTWHTQIFRL